MTRSGLVPALCIVASTGCPADTPKPDPARREAADRAVRQLQVLAGALAPAVRAPNADTPCPELGAARPYALVDATYFAQFRGAGFRPESPADRWYRREDFTMLALGMAATPRDDEAVSKGYAAVAARASGKSLVIALHPTEDRRPTLKEASSPEKVVITPGRFEGWAYLLDPRAGTLECAAQLSATNSPDLFFGEGEDPEKVAFHDFRDALTRALENAFEARGVRLERYRW